MDEKDLELVAAAFERLLEKIGKSGCDPEYGRTVYFAKVDVLDILAGKWDEESPGEDTPEEEPPDAAEDWSGEVGL